MKFRFSSLFGLALRLLLLLVMASGPIYLALSHFATFEPYLFPLHAMQGTVRAASARVLVGPYPDEQLLEALRRRRIKVIVSLLDPKLLYEASLIRRESMLASALGITEIHAPMNSSEPPDSPLNAAALSKIRDYLAQHPDERVYIHCYLGKHRAQTVADMLVAQAKH